MRITNPSPSKITRALSLLVGLGLIAAACGSDDDVGFDGVQLGSTTIVNEDDITFAEISPFATFGSAQGEFSSGSHGTFGIFGAGASSPPHTHSGAYYAVVLSGDMNNPFGDETNAPTLTPGSFWAVPAEDEHVTACLSPDSECRFFFHAASAFDFTQIEELAETRSANASAIPNEDLAFGELEPYNGSALVWGDPETGPYGTIIGLESGQETGELAHRNAFTLVPIAGRIAIVTGDETRTLAVNSLLEAEANAPHALSCDGAEDCLFYLYSDGPQEISQAN